MEGFPALAMGNTIVAKPSEITPRSAGILAEICQTVGLPNGVFNLVHGLGAGAGQSICEHPDINLISFTGGTVTGRRVAATAAPLFKKLSLELGGKNATIVFADCDWELSVKGAVRAAFTNQGQVCLAGSRVLIERPIYDKFVAAMVEEAKKLQCGNPATSDFGCVSSLEHRAKIESYIELARKDGAQILCGGKRPNLPAPFDAGAFIEPTIIAGLPSTHACSVEEISTSHHRSSIRLRIRSDRHREWHEVWISRQRVDDESESCSSSRTRVDDWYGMD